MTALFRKGFRPFFTLAGLWSALAIAAWLLVLRGQWAPVGPLAGVAWHAHEMVFGFTGALIAGFLLTATSNWTGRETLSGRPLAVAALVWCAARVGLAFVPGVAGLVADLLFLPIVAVAIARPIVATGQRRNLLFPVLLLALWAIDLVGHVTHDEIGAARAGVSVAIVMIVAITSRVVPMFTRNATGARWIASDPRLDRAAIGLAILAPIAVTWAPAAVAAAVCGLCAVVLALRARRWGFGVSLGDPLLLVLHVGHALVAVGFALRGLAALGLLAPTLAIHAWTVGGIGLVGLGMMARVSLGHTGRPIVAPRLVAGMFGVLALVAIVRVVGPMVAPALWLSWITVSGVAWTVAFAVWLGIYAPWLASPRVDGRDG